MTDVGRQNQIAPPGASNAGAKFPEETLKIRRLLTIYLASLITFPDDQPASHFQLCHPETALEVKEIPKQVIGLHRQYLKEIQANIKARQNYQDLLESRKGDGGSLATDGEVVGGGKSRLETHLKLLQMRKRHKEVQITRHYFEKLRETKPGKDGSFEFRPPPPEVDDDSGLPDLLQASLESDVGPRHGESTEELTKKLERAVVKAKHQLEREKALLAQVKEKHIATKNAQGDASIQPRARIHALAATRDELVRFLEETMSSVVGLEEDNAAEHGDEPALNIEGVQEEIAAEYERYITSRKRLLDIAANVLSDPGPADNNPTREAIAVETRARASAPVSALSKISPLPFISEQLMPLLQSQRANASQESHTTKVLNTEKANALESLDRLADESHLLPAYPIMARQERFKNVVTALGGPRKLDPAMADTENDTAVMIRRAEAWAFAADEARKAEGDLVKEKVRYGNERLNGAEGSLKVLDELLGRDPQKLGLGGQENSEADIWLEAADAATNNAQSRSARTSQQEKGPWAGLNGRVGIVGGKQS